MKLDKLRRIKLKNLLINRIDLVDEGDNPEAKIMIWKRAPDIQEKKKPRLLTELEITEISLVDKGANSGSLVTLYKRDVSKAVADPSHMLGINLLRVLQTQVENLRLGANIARIEAWSQVLETSEGQKLLGLISKMEGDPTLIFKDMEDRDVSEICDFVEGPHLGSFVKALKGELKKGIIVQKEITVVEKIKKKSFDSQIEASNKLKLELAKLAPASDKRSPERRYVDYMDAHPDVRDAMLELPDVVVTEPVEKRDFGKTYEKISKMVDELVFKGEVSSRAKGFVKVMDNNPELLVSYYKEQQG